MAQGGTATKRIQLYHFLNERWGLDDLKNRRLKISSLLNLNDPFEFASLDLSDSNLRLSVKAGVRSMAKEAGMICFSASWRSPVQWAHYADRHKGLCLGFSIPRDIMEKVSYVKERGMLFGQMSAPSVKKLLTTKYEEWSYEKEFRTFVELKEQEGDGNYYADFGENLRLNRVIIGANSQIKNGELKECLGNLCGKVKVFKARPAFKSFKMTPKKDWKFS